MRDGGEGGTLGMIARPGFLVLNGGGHRGVTARVQRVAGKASRAHDEEDCFGSLGAGDGLSRAQISLRIGRYSASEHALCVLEPWRTQARK